MAQTDKPDDPSPPEPAGPDHAQLIEKALRDGGDILAKALPESDRLLAQARDKSIAGRETMASAFGRVMTEHGERFSEHEATLANDILRTLVRDVERSVRAALAANLAGSSAAPRDVILALANDEIEVAFPILAESPILDDPELMQIVADHATGHRLAIAMRPGLSERVGDALIATGDVEAIACLLQNNDARISRPALTRLVDDAKATDVYHTPLSGRHDLGPELAFKLASAVSRILRKRLVDEYDLDEDAVREAAADAVVDATEALSDRREGETENLTGRRREVRQMVETLRRKEWPHFEAAMARFAGLSAHLTHAILAERDGRKFTVLCRACGVQKPDFASLFLLSRRATPDAEIVDADDVRTALALFDRIERAAATRVLTRWRATPSGSARRRSAAAG